MLRMKVGKEIGSAAFMADGQHARIDGWTSLAVLFGAIGVRLGYPVADTLIGLLITAMIGHIVWHSGWVVFTRLLDGVDPEVVGEINEAATRVQGIHEVTDVRIRWLGHRMHTEVNIAVDAHSSVEQGHALAKEVRHQLLHHLPYLSNATIHIDPVNASGEHHHHITEHEHDDHQAYSH